MDLDGCNVEAAWRRALVLEKVLQQCRNRELGDKMPVHDGLERVKEQKSLNCIMALCKKRNVVKHDVKTIVTTSLICLQLYV